jgi:hypothetical protein
MAAQVSVTIDPKISCLQRLIMARYLLARDTATPLVQK